MLTFFKSKFCSLPPTRQSAFLLIFALSALSIADSFVHLLSDKIGIGQFHFIRSSFAIICIFITARFFKIKLLPIRWRPVLVRTIFMSLAFIMYFSAISFLPIAVAGAGLFTSPVFTLLFSIFFFGEKLDLGRIGAICVGTAGVFFAFDIFEAEINFMVFLPVLAGSCYAFGNIITNHYCKDESPFALIFTFFVFIGLTGLGMSFVLSSLNPPGLSAETEFLLRGWQQVSFQDLYLIFGIALITMVTIAMIARAYQLSEASGIVIYEYSYLLSALLFGWFYWGSKLSHGSIFGIALIFISGVLINFAILKK